MTLIIGMSKADGLYMSADYRITLQPGGKIHNETATKLVAVSCPPSQTGTRMLMGFAGRAYAGDGTPLGFWLLETLRGEDQLPDALIAHLLERMNRDLTDAPYPLILVFLALQGDRRWFGAITNTKGSTAGPARFLGRFVYALSELAEPKLLLVGSGAFGAAADKERARIVPQLSVQTRRPMDHMKLLATANRRIAAKVPSVSTFSMVAHAPQSATEYHFNMQNFTDRGESVPFRIPHILFGIDADAFMRRDPIMGFPKERPGTEIDRRK